MKKMILMLLVLVCLSCHARQVSDVRLDMTRDEVVAAWGKTLIITYEKGFEIWEYHFGDDFCWVIFKEGKVAATRVATGQSNRSIFLNSILPALIIRGGNR